MRGQALRPQPPGEEPREREDADLGPEVQADGHARPGGCGARRRGGGGADPRAAPGWGSADHPGKEEHLADLHEARAQRRAAGTHGRNPPQRPGPGRQRCAAEDQEQVSEQVEHVGQHCRPDERAGPAHRLRVAALSIEGQQGADAGEPPPDELPRGPSDAGRDAERLEKVGEPERGEHQHGARRQRHAEGLPVEPPRPQRVARSEGLADRRVGAHQDPDTDDAHREHHRVAQRCAGELDRTGPPHHRGIHEAHQRLSGLGESQRQREAEQDAQLVRRARRNG